MCIYYLQNFFELTRLMLIYRLLKRGYFMKRLALVSVVVLLACMEATATDSTPKFIPSSAPVSIRPSDTDETMIGYGYDIITLKLNWDEPFFNGSVDEKIGEIDYTINNFCIGFLRKRTDVSTLELDLAVGAISSKAANNQFTSSIINQGVTVDHSGDGKNIGIRAIYGRSLGRTLGADGGLFIDWIFAASLHAAYFKTENNVSGISDDGLFAEEYSETDNGFFFRPSIAFQPVIYVSDRISLNPFVGYGSTFAVATYKWELTDARFAGIPFDPASGFENLPFAPQYELTQTKSETIDLGSQLYLGFDVGIRITKSGQGLSVGAAISKLMGAAGDNGFTEAHVLYSVPFGSGK
jgi:hypothetical protein